MTATVAIDKLNSLHDKNVKVISGFGRSAAFTLKLFAYLEENPIIEIQKTPNALGMAFNTVAAAVNRLCNAGILIQSGGEIR